MKEIHIPSYPKVYALGHRYLEQLFEDIVIVEEKVDGSQFSFGCVDGFLVCRSKGCDINIDAPEKLFATAVLVAKELFDKGMLIDGYIYRAEYLVKPKHNALCYNRVPKNYLILFDISLINKEEEYLSYDLVNSEAERLGLECVPLLFRGKIEAKGFLMELLKQESILGGQLIEGVVVKNYNRFGIDGKALMGKFVSESFKEVHRGSWKESNPNHNDIVQNIIDMYKTPARWNKAIQHLKEKGILDNSPTDIGKLIKEVQSDISAECSDEIKEILFKWAIPKIHRGVVSKLPEWYKEKLLESQFEEKDV